ncbi:MAG TPA: hypothetical protein VLA61_10725 [Ideonella sp.]|uniref:hypothetical protein n=1 Tax=Ideonella sp. TaxID=1929293 RepID=UPI002C96E20C|nr:hypothetical protein [Ideonella sp.]HSI48735.1 hypothetical protein [Ideonella sp.]
MALVQTRHLTGLALEYALGVHLSYPVGYQFDSKGFSLYIEDERGQRQAWAAGKDRQIRALCKEVTAYHLAGEWNAKHAHSDVKIEGARDQQTAELRCVLLAVGVQSFDTPRELL